MMGNSKLNRQQAPALDWGAEIDFPHFTHTALRNGSDFYSLSQGDVPAIRVDLIFPGGRLAEEIPLQAQVSMELLTRGTDHLDSEEFARRLDFLGASLDSQLTDSHSALTLTCVANRFDEAWELLEDALLHPSYDADFLRYWCTRGKTELEVLEQSSSHLAGRQVREALHPHHGLGRMPRSADYDHLTPELVRGYYQRYIRPEGAKIVVTGSPSPERLAGIRDRIEGLDWIRGEDQRRTSPPPIVEKDLPRYAPIEAPIGHQLSIDLAKVIDPLPLEEMLNLYISTMLLGGFFGSRLMRNIREEKGYTYGIYAGLRQLQGAHELHITSDIGNQYAPQAVKEVEGELIRLQTDLVATDELEVVRAYMRGAMLRNFDGVFAASGQLRKLLTHAYLPADFHSRYLEALTRITPEQVRETARRHFSPKSFTLGAAGAPDTLRSVDWPMH